MPFKVSPFQVGEVDPFLNDRFGRKPIVEFLSGIIEKAGGPFVLAIDSPWGTGKTATVQMLKAHIENSGFMCVYFDAWRADYISDPLVAMLGTMDQLNFSKSPLANEHFSKARKIATGIARRMLVGGVRFASGGLLDIDDYGDIIEELAVGATEDVVDAFNKEQDVLEKLREELEKAVSKLQEVENNKKTLVFFIDELDRCRPDFALSVLERMKHLFDLANIHFVLSIDKAQLESSVCAVHGEKINSSEYLRRFFDLEFGLPEGDSKEYTKFLVKQFELENYFSERTGEVAYDGEQFIECFSAMADVFSLTLRAREKCLTRMMVVTSQTPPNKYLDPELTAFLIILRSVDNKFFKAVAAGAVSTQQVVDYIKSREGGAGFMSEHMGAVLYGLLIAHGADRKKYNEEAQALRDQYRVAVNAADNKDNSWLETALRVVEHQDRRAGRRIITSIAGKIDLSAQLRN